MNSNFERTPLVQEVPAKYQSEWFSYIKSRQGGWMTAEQWLAHRVAGSGCAVKISTLASGTTRTEGTLKPINVKPAPEPPAKPVSVVDLGQRPVSAIEPRHGIPMTDEALHSTTGEVVTREKTIRTDF